MVCFTCVQFFAFFFFFRPFDCRRHPLRFHEHHRLFVVKAWGIKQNIIYNHMCQGLNSHYFHIIGDGHQPNSRGLYTHHKDSYLRWDDHPQYSDFWPWHIFLAESGFTNKAEKPDWNIFSPFQTYLAITRMASIHLIHLKWMARCVLSLGSLSERHLAGRLAVDGLKIKHRGWLKHWEVVPLVIILLSGPDGEQKWGRSVSEQQGNVNFNFKICWTQTVQRKHMA